jgi:O-antigen/teichoic acid export membrane protein
MFKNAQIRNILWMFVDKAFLLFGSFIVTIMIARYLGPEKLGYFSYGIALSGLAVAISQWGANYTIFDTAAKNEKRSANYIKSTEKKRLYLYILTFIIIGIYVYIFNSYSVNDYMVVVLVIISQVFLGMDIYQYHYNAILKSKINAKSAIISKAISMSMRLALIYYDANYMFFVIPFFVEGIICYVIRRKYLEYEVSGRGYDVNVFSSSYFSVGIPLTIISVCVVLYTKINEILLGALVSYESLGVFSVALTLNYAWTFIPMAIGVSLLSKPIKEIDDSEKISGYSFVTVVTILCSLPILAVVYFYSEYILFYTFGVEYESAGKILFILSIGCLLGIVGFITNRMINSFSGGRGYLLKKVIFSSILMLSSSYLLVSNYGLYGAAYGVVLTEALNLTIFNYFFNRGLVIKIHLGVFSNFNYFKRYRG